MSRAHALTATLVLIAACAPEPPRASAPAAGLAPAVTSTSRAARYEADHLVLPADYRDWAFVTSGIDMSYSEEAKAMGAGHSTFDNVFADPVAYRSFMSTGHWPDGSVLVLEVRGAATHGSINKAGHYQSQDLLGLEVHVKDVARFAAMGGWAFFGFGSKDPAAPLPASKDCYECHRDHGLVDTTFVQFYPVLLDVAAAKGTAKTVSDNAP
jgi:hypothetical protein